MISMKVIGRGSAHIVLAGHPHGSNDSSDYHHSATPETVLRVALDSSGRSIQAVNKSRQHIAALAPLLGESYVPPLETVVIPKEAYPMIDSKTPKKSKSRPNKEVSGGTNENNSQIRSSEWGLLAPNLMSMWLPLPNGAEDHRRLLVGEQTRRNEEAMIESEVSRGGSSKNTALLRPYSEVYGHASLGTGRSAASSCCPQVVTVELKPKAAMEAAARSLLVGLATVIHDDGNDDGGGTCASRSEELDDEEDALGAFVEGNGRTASSFDSKRPSNATIAYRFTADHDVKFRHSRFDMTQAQKLLGTHTSATKQRSEFKPADLFAVAAAAAAAAAEASASSSFPSPLPGGGDDDGDDDGDLTVLYGHDSRRKTAAVKEQQVRYAELSKAMKTKEAEIKRMAARLQLAETAAQQRHQARSSGNQAWSVVDESENDDDDDDDSENEDTGGIACRDIGDLNPTEHPDRLTVTESRVLHDDAARTQSATLYRNYYIKLQIQGFLDQLLVLKRAVAVLRINKKRVDRVIKAGCVDTDLPNARTSMRHELEHLRKAVKVLQGKIQGATIADDCVKPEDAQMLIEKRWAMSDKRASKLLTVVKEVHDSHAFLQQPGAPGADLAPGAK